MSNVLQLHPVQAQNVHRQDAPAVAPGAWEVERDLIRGRTFDRTSKFMPDGLSQAARLEFLDAHERVLFSQIQGRTYANVACMLERFIGANLLELSRLQVLGDQDVLESLVQGAQDELKHQALFGRIDQMMAGAMAQGYRFVPRPNDFAWVVLGRSRWSVLALTCMVELVTQAHCREAIAPDPTLSELYQDVFLFHWHDEQRHAAVTEREWRTEDVRLTAKERDCAVDDLLELVRTMNMLLQRQAAADGEYFFGMLQRSLEPLEAGRVHAAFVGAYRWQYILAGIQHEHYADVLAELVSDEQGARIAAGIHPLAVPPVPRAIPPKRIVREGAS